MMIPPVIRYLWLTMRAWPEYIKTLHISPSPEIQDRLEGGIVTKYQIRNVMLKMFQVTPLEGK